MTVEKLSVVGTRVRKVDGYELVTGKAKYAGDMRFPGLVYGYAARSKVCAGRITRIGIADRYTEHGPQEVLREKEGLSAEKIALRVKQVLKDKPVPVA